MRYPLPSPSRDIPKHGLRWATLRVFGVLIWSRVLRYQEADIPVQIERITEIPRLQVLELLGESLQLEVAKQLALPAPETLKDFEPSLRRLKVYNLLPKPSDSPGLEFYTATPGALRNSRPPQGKFTLALQSDLDAAWLYLEDIGSHAPAENAISVELLASIAQLVSQCSAVGGEEIFLGYPDPSSYEFVARSNHYRGSLSPRILEDLLKILNCSSSLNLSLDLPECEHTTISFVSGVARGILIIHWSALIPLKEAPVSTSTECATLLNQFTPPTQTQTSLMSLVLVIDDDERFGAILCGLLQSHSLETKRFANAEDAFRFLGDAHAAVKLIILDLHLGDDIGSELLPRLRRISIAPILLVTSDESIEREIELIEKGADGYVKKSADPELLFAWCTNLIARTGERRSSE